MRGRIKYGETNLNPDYIWVTALVTSPIWVLGLLCVWEEITILRPSRYQGNSGSKFG
jgi:hypothetical protein